MDKYKNTLLDLFKNALLALLDDPEIKQAIKKMTSSGTDHDIRDEIDGLRKEREENQQMIAKLKALVGLGKSENLDLQSRAEKLTTALDSEKNNNAALTKKIKKTESRLEQCEGMFKEDVAAYQLFDKLGHQTKASLSGIFKADSMAGFIACGIQERNIDNLWEYLKNEVMEDKNDDLPSLKKIFEFLFSRYSLAYPLYELQSVETGDVFDPQNHIKHSGSQNVSGKIQAISLPGWVNRKTGKLIKQSVVVI